MRKALVAALLLLATSATPSFAWVSVNIGFSVPTYPALVAVPGVPVYYAPSVNANYFFYDGMYWNFDGTQWYSSAWYNGPWGAVEPAAVPVYLWRVPVRYYRAPPPYFTGWAATSPPMWGAHWGPVWVNEHRDWDHWDHNYRPVYAPLPTYQARYSGAMYPRVEAQAQIHAQNYHYVPKDAVVRTHYEQRGIAAEQTRINREQHNINREQANINREQHNVNREQANVKQEQHNVKQEQHAVNQQQHVVNKEQQHVQQQQHEVHKEQQHVNKEQQKEEHEQHK
jgi:hypothetical protein